MRLGEGALAFEAGGDRRLEQLRYRLQLGPRLGVVDALAGVNEGSLGGDQLRGRRVHVRGTRSRQDASCRLVIDLAFDLLVPHVAGYFDEHRARTAVTRHGERTPQRRNEHFRSVDLLGLFDDVLEIEGGVESRTYPGLVA